jgi:hypothetical protein
MIKTKLATLLAAKIMVPVAASAAAGGIAVAAATGTLPSFSDAPSGPPASHAPATPASKESAPDKAAGEPSPSLEGLCHAYTAGAGAEHGKALDSPAFTVLITTAGGEDKVAGYCADLLGSDAKKSPAEATVPVTPAHPTGSPTARPSVAPASKPATAPQPTNIPTSAPRP